jgi:cytoskeleton protein RodZ
MEALEQEQLFDDPIGQRLKSAREAKGLSLQDVANQTRIPVRHLESIEKGQWDALPATTYSIGFARNYANAVGLDGTEIGTQLRDQLGAAPKTSTAIPEYYEPTDPARVPPWWLAVAAVVLALLIGLGYFTWRDSSVGLDGGGAPVAEAPQPVQDPGTAVPAQQEPVPTTGPVVLTATEEVWLRIDRAGGGAALFQGILAPGQRFEVPADAERPVVRTGRPQVIRIAVGGRDIGTLGPTERTVSNVSLLPEDIVSRIQGGGEPGVSLNAPAGAQQQPPQPPSEIPAD